MTDDAAQAVMTEPYDQETSAQEGATGVPAPRSRRAEIESGLCRRRRREGAG